MSNIAVTVYVDSLAAAAALCAAIEKAGFKPTNTTGTATPAPAAAAKAAAPAAAPAGPTLKDVQDKCKTLIETAGKGKEALVKVFGQLPGVKKLSDVKPEQFVKLLELVDAEMKAEADPLA